MLTAEAVALLADPIRAKVVTNSILLARRIQELQKRRNSLRTTMDEVRSHLPDWALEPLRLVGKTNEEIRELVAQLASTEGNVGLDEMEKELQALDATIERLESELVQNPSTSLQEIEAVARLAVRRLHDLVVTDPNDVFFDATEARVLSIVEHAHSGIVSLLRDLDAQSSKKNTSGAQTVSFDSNRPDQDTDLDEQEVDELFARLQSLAEDSKKLSESMLHEHEIQLAEMQRMSQMIESSIRRAERWMTTN